MTGFVLRIVAMSTMLLDHIGWNFIDNPMLLTWIGRIAFPCYAFLLAEGFFFVFRDKRRFIKHLSTLILLTIISELGYDIMCSGFNFSGYIYSQSVMGTLLLGFLGMSLTELIFPSRGEKSDKFQWKNIIILVCAYFLIGFSNYKMDADYALVGPLLIIAYYWYLRYARNEEKTENKWNWIKRFLALLGIMAVYLIILYGLRRGDLLAEMKHEYPWVAGHILAALILSFSNGKLGYHKKWFKIFYTLFYPVHTLIIGIITIILYGQ